MKKIHEELEKVLKSKVLVKVLYIVGVVIIIGLIFSAGTFVGFHKASFGCAWGDNYYKNFGMGMSKIGQGGPMKNFGMMNDYFPNAHGVIGKILKIELPNMIVLDKDNFEKIIVIKNDTLVHQMREVVTVNNLKVDDFVTIIGSPNSQGQIEAKLIRIMPAPNFLQN
ncbi:MAG: hypothetical protein WC662_02455 [Candidatus Paceibacterota bacterium]|jgi:hypothetical protein